MCYLQTFFFKNSICIFTVFYFILCKYHNNNHVILFITSLGGMLATCSLSQTIPFLNVITPQSLVQISPDENKYHVKNRLYTKCLMAPWPKFICLKLRAVIMLQRCSYWEEPQCPFCSEPVVTPFVLVLVDFLPRLEL